MSHNDVTRSLRYLLDASDTRMVEILRLGGGQATLDQVRAFLLPEGDPGEVAVDDRTLAQLLDGVIVFRRGRDEARPLPPLEPRVTNNVVLKKLRVAFELKDVDLHAIFAAAGKSVTKPELSAFFRKPDHPHYRTLGDQYLRAFLRGLGARLRGS